MENTMSVTTPTETQISNPVTPVIPDISLNPMDFQKEMAKIAAEHGMKLEGGNVVPAAMGPTDGNVVQTQTQKAELPAGPKAAAQPIPLQAAEQPRVPEKFQTSDGQVDLEKVAKSTINAEEALKRYQDLEVELRRKQNEVNALKLNPVQVEPQQPVPQAMQTQQVSQLTPELINKALEDTKNPGKVLLDLLAIRDQAVYSQARTDIMAEVSPLKARVENQQRQAELQTIADRDPWVFSEEGIKALSAVRASKPWLNSAPEPWLEAYKDVLATREMQKSGSQVLTPTPTASTVRAPATPVEAGNRTQAQAPSLAQLANDPRALNKFLDSLPNEAARSAFWRSALPGAK